MRDRPLKIAVFSDSALPQLNGVAVGVEMLCTSLRERGHDVKLFSPYSPESISCHAIGYPGLKVSFGFPTVPQFRPDIIHIHTPFGAGLSGLAWAKLLRVPTVATFHTHYGTIRVNHPLWGSALMLASQRRAAKLVFSKADRLTVPSQTAEGWLRSIIGKRPCDVIPTGIAKVESSPATGDSALWVGRLEPEKRLDLLLDALELSPTTTVRVVGDGSLANWLREEVMRRGLVHRVSLLGRLSPERVREEMKRSSYLIHTATHETQGLVIAEALSCGLPVALCASGGATDAIAYGGGVPCAPQAARLAEVMTQFDTCQPMREAKATEALAAARNFLMELMVGKWEEVYFRALRSDVPSYFASHAKDS